MTLPSIRRSRLAATVAVATLGLSLAACGSSGASSAAAGKTGHQPSSAAPGGSATGSGPVNVLYAGSLVDLMKSQVGPGFKKTTGYTLSGIAGGSSGLAEQIKGKVHQGDVFISADPTVNKTLMGSKNGNWVTWYATYSSSPLVIGYNSKSTFAADLKSKPWYNVVTKSGFRLGRTDPVTDPKGALAEQALKDQAKQTPALTKIANSKSGVYPEETLVGRLQAGQLDAGFFYKSEAVAAKIPTVPLTGQKLKAVYTITILKNAPHPKAAKAFVRYLLGSSGAAYLKKNGYNVISPAKSTGHVPAQLQDVLPSS